MPKSDVEEDFVPRTRGQLETLEGLCHSRYLRMKNIGNMGKPEQWVAWVKMPVDVD